jgi:murein peptide amidase A
MTRGRRLATVAVCSLGAAAAAPAPATAGERPFGRSAHGRELVVSAPGRQAVRRTVLVIGCIHGTECAGVAIARRLTDGRPPADADVWVVPDLNPDGHRMRVRVNARGVDLNRNFAGGWRPIGARGDPEYAGPHPFSEAETRAVRRLVELVDPAVTIWYHQGQGPLVRAWDGSVPTARAYARISGLPFERMRWLAGTAPHWQNLAYPGTSSFVVELPDGALTAAETRRHAAAVMALARDRRGTRRRVGGSVQAGR